MRFGRAAKRWRRSFAMAEYKRSSRVEAKLAEIYARTENTFGRYQADAYATGLERIFGLLADFPKMSVEAYHLAPAHRRFQFQSHYIFYTEEPYGVFIRDLFHVAQDIRPALFR